MTLAIFDLDNTLLAGDSDHAWGEFLVRRGLVDGGHYQAQNDRFYADYCRGQLDIIAYSEFVFAVLARETPETLAAWHRAFMQEQVASMILPKGRQLLQAHREKGHRLVIITATNRFITGPIAAELGVTDLIATEPEQVDGRYTGKVHGTPCYQHGKIIRMEQWLAKEQARQETSAAVQLIGQVSMMPSWRNRIGFIPSHLFPTPTGCGFAME